MSYKAIIAILGMALLGTNEPFVAVINSLENEVRYEQTTSTESAKQKEGDNPVLIEQSFINEITGANQQEESPQAQLTTDKKIIHDVPFTSQAPLGNWSDTRQEYGCEEASALMAMRWVKQEPLSRNESRDKIIEISEFEQEKYGEYRDTSAIDTMNWIFKDYFNYNKVNLINDISAKDIKRELAQNNIVLIPFNGRKIGNPHYKPPGPKEHMFVIKGYDPSTDEFIVNDPGTRYGNSMRFKVNVIENSLRDYPTGLHEPVDRIEKRMIVVSR